MTTLVVPPLDAEPWPTLGPQLCDFIEANLPYGPGPKAGEPYVVEPEFRAQLYRAYEVFPQGHARAGRRRFKRVGLSTRKGTAKTEKAMLVAACEAHPDAPVRCDGFDAEGRPVGRGVPSTPYIPLLAITQEQQEDLGFNQLRWILGESELQKDFAILEDRILVLDPWGREAGKILSLATSPNARDGARTTFQHFDETHRLTLPRLVKAHATMLENIYKIVQNDAWSLETTTAPEPGSGAVAEATMEYAELIEQGKVKDPALFFFHRQATKPRPLDTPEQVREALLEASGPQAAWSGDIDALVDHYFEPKCDRSYYRRVWLNWLEEGGDKYFSAEHWAQRFMEQDIPPGERVTLGFDGARFDDSTALIATHVESGHQWPVGIWEKDPSVDDWEVDEDDVTTKVDAAFDTWRVARFYADPPHWNDNVNVWAGRYGKRVKEWWTNRPKPMAYALRAYSEAIVGGEMGHNGDPDFARHIANSYRFDTGYLDEKQRPLYTIRKERRDSPRKIDAAMAGCLSWEARGDAIAAGVLKRGRRSGGGSM